MDNDEVKIMRVKETSMQRPRKDGRGPEQFDGFLQKDSFFVIPQMDKLKAEKIELKAQMGVARPGAQQHAKLRVVGAGSELTKKDNLYYVSVL